MLVITRKERESIMIGHGIEIVIVQIQGRQIRVGIKCSRDIPIDRKEVYDLRETGKYVKRDLEKPKTA